MSPNTGILEDLGRADLCVSGGAGVGKTRLLIDAYFRALELVGREVREPYERVVAITFTNEAATEVRKRVVERLLGPDSAADPDRVLQANTIGTIHSFCQGLLREFGHLIGVNPLFEIPDDVELAELQRKVAATVAGEMLDCSSTARSAELLFGLYPFEGWQFVPGLLSWVHLAYTRARWLLLDAHSTRDAMIAAWRELVAPVLVKDPVERPGRISEKFKIPRSLVNSVCQFMNDHQPVVTAFAEFTRRYWERLDSEKAAAGWLSQDDTLYHTARLLEKSEIRQILQERYRFLLIDEYQDTDPLQHRVVEALRTPGATFRVGDLKQSIYRFRNARPWIFGGLLTKAKSEGALRSLSTNRRAIPELRDFWNEVFPRIFTDHSGVIYEPLKGEPPFYSGLVREEPPVEIFRIPREIDGARADPRQVEARWVARRIQQLVGQFKIYDVRKEDWREAQFRDCAVLFRVKTHVERYLAAFTELGIPYVFVGGKEFFSQPEVRTLVTALHWIADPTSPFYTAAVLRSALFGINDRTLLALSKRCFQVTPEVYEDLRAGDEVEAGKVGDFLSLRERLLDLREGPASRVLEELLRATGFAEAVLAHPQGVQKYGNIRRLVTLVREYDAKAGGSLPELARRLGRAVDEEQEEPEALVADEGSDAVRVMTVHAAKGLEFPIVFVPEVFRHQRPIRRDFLVDAYEDRKLIFFLGPKVQKNLPKRVQEALRNVTSCLERRVFQREVQEVDAEERRLLYVAFTRAREYLAFSLPEPVEERGSPPEIPPWSRLLEPLLGPAITAGVEVATVPGGSARFRVVRDVAPLLPQALLRDRLKAYPERAVEILRPRRAERVLPVISAGAVADYRYCPYRYFLAHEVGLPGVPALRLLEEGGSEAEKGTLVHVALQHCDFSTGKIPEGILARAGEDRKKLEKIVRNFLDSTEGREVRGLPADRVLREARIRAPLRGTGGTMLVGIVDLAYETDIGWKVVEYKTGDPRPETRELYADQTRVYVTGLRIKRGLNVSEVVVAYVAHPEHTWTRFSPSQQDLPEEELARIANACSRGEFEAHPTRERCGPCPYGGRRGICPKRHRPTMESRV